MKTLVTTILARSTRLDTAAGCGCPTKDGKAPCHCGPSCACQGCTCKK